MLALSWIKLQMLDMRFKRKYFLWLRLIVQAPRIFFYWLLSENKLIGKVKLQQPLQLAGSGLVEFKDNVRIGYYPSPYFFSTYAYIDARNASSRIAIGENTKINNNFCVIAEFKSIEIGSRCLIGTNVEILDSDFHGMKISERGVSNPESAASVMIGDDVFIGNNVRILKGVSIGNGSVIANGSIVVTDIPANSIAGGVPAKVIRAID